MSQLEGIWRALITPEIFGPVSVILTPAITILLWRVFQAPVQKRMEEATANQSRELVKIQIELESSRERETHRVSLIQESRKQHAIDLWSSFLEVAWAFNAIFRNIDWHDRDLKKELLRLKVGRDSLGRNAATMEIFFGPTEHSKLKSVVYQVDKLYQATENFVRNRCQFSADTMFHDKNEEKLAELRKDSDALSEGVHTELLNAIRCLLGVELSCGQSVPTALPEAKPQITRP